MTIINLLMGVFIMPCETQNAYRLRVNNQRQLRHIRPNLNRKRNKYHL